MPPDLIIPKDIDSFDLKRRLAVLAGLARELTLETSSAAGSVNRVCEAVNYAHGVINHASSVVNMHIHSFYSYNARGYSPAHIAYLCRLKNFYAAALCDFDVLDGLEEFFTAGQMLGLRVAIHIETRAYLREYAHLDINSPGEPGVAYIMGAGFGYLPSPDSKAAIRLSQFRSQANLRNKALVERINSRLPEIAIDYDLDVRPLSPGGCPTERHIVQAFSLKARQSFPDQNGLSDFWAELFCASHDEIELFLENPTALEEKIRSLLVKSGGIGYVPPAEETFPPADDFITWVLSCNAVPMVAWLDGTSPGEEGMMQMLECLKAKGAAALNIIPERNHNIKNVDERGIKLRKLNEIISAARKFSFPINIGTEMHKNGQPFSDDLKCEALSPYREDFLRGANVMIGQTILARYAGFSYCGKSALNEYGSDTERKNNFFEAVGKLPPLNPDNVERLKDMGNEKAFQSMRDSSRRGKWKL